MNDNHYESVCFGKPKRGSKPNFSSVQMIQQQTQHDTHNPSNSNTFDSHHYGGNHSGQANVSSAYDTISYLYHSQSGNDEGQLHRVCVRLALFKTC